MAARGCLRGAPGLDEDAEHDGDLAAVDQIVHDVLGAEIAVGILESLAVLEDHERGGNGGIVLSGDVDPVGVLVPGKTLLWMWKRTLDFTFGDAILREGVGAER